MERFVYRNGKHSSLSSAGISLIVCSRDRSTKLRQFLDNLVVDDFLRTGAELVLVDNGSGDSTLAEMESFAGRQPFPVLVAVQPHPGLSRARNTGVRHSRAALLAFTDDDCVLDSLYLSNCVKLFENERWAYAGGTILPGNECRPAYGTRHYTRQLVVHPGTVLPAGLISGANMVFRRRVFEVAGLFDTSLGAGTRYRCEDVD